MLFCDELKVNFSFYYKTIGYSTMDKLVENEL